MRILFCVDDFKGGAGNVVQLLSNELFQRKHKISICILGGNTPGRYSLDGITVHRLPPSSNRLWRFYNHILDVRRIIKREKPDCVVSFLFGVSSFVNLSMLGVRIPLIVSERSDPNFLKPSGFLKVLTEYAYLRSKRIIVLFDCFRTISGAKYLDKVIVIPNPVPKIENLNHNRSEYEDGVHFVTIANDTPPKGLDLLISAFSLVNKCYPNATLRIYGSQKDNRLKQQIVSLGIDKTVSLMGYTMDIKEPLSWADVYVMPSRHEGFPNSLCEAMSAGKCCIATVCHEGIKELIDDGENGLLAETENVQALANKMIFIINHHEKISLIGKRAASISSIYSLNTIVDMWETEIKRCCKSIL